MFNNIGTCLCIFVKTLFTMNTFYISFPRTQKINYLKKQIKYGLFTLTYLLVISTIPAFGQKIGINKSDPQEALDVNGKIKVGNDNNNNSSPGTIRFNPETGDFEGFDGNEWESFTKNPAELFWPAYRDRGAIGNYIPLSMNDAEQGDEFGYSVDMDGSYAVVGSPGWNDNVGRIIVYKREPLFGFWNAVETLNGPAGSNGTRFGHSVSISGNRIVVGAPKLEGEYAGVTTEVGGIYIFKLENDNLIFEKLKYGFFGCGSNLGISVDIRGMEVVAGASNATAPPCPPFDNGSVYYYNVGNDTGYWIFAKTFSVSAVNQFGHAVSFHNEWLAIGAPFSTTVNEDSVYIYRRLPGGFFTHFQTLTSGNFDDQFGVSLEINGNVLIVGGRAEDGVPGDNRGKTRIYNFDTTLNKWVERLIIAGIDIDCGLGHAVACGSTNLLTAANFDLTSNSTEMTIYRLIDGYYRRYVEITDPAATNTDNAINDVALSGNYFIIGLPQGTSDNGKQGGRVFIGKIR